MLNENHKLTSRRDCVSGLVNEAVSDFMVEKIFRSDIVNVR